MASFEVVIPPGSEKTYQRFHFAPATKVGSTVYCSGVIGADGADVPGEAADEFALAFTRLAGVLETAGASLENIVEMTSFHVDMSRHLGAFMAAKDAVMKEPFPAWTAIGCTELAIPGARVEIKATAVISS